MKLDTQRLKTLDEVRAFIAGSSPCQFTLTNREEAYTWLQASLLQFRYATLGKLDKGALRAYLAKTTGFSRAQITRLIGQYLTHGNIRDRRGTPAQPFARRYTTADVELLVEIDTLHDTLSGPATRKLCERALDVFGNKRFAQLAQISNGHLYNHAPWQCLSAPAPDVYQDPFKWRQDR